MKYTHIYKGTMPSVLLPAALAIFKHPPQGSQLLWEPCDLMNETAINKASLTSS